ncbi:cytochrome c [Thalassobius vesicularis]|uniref:Cytochrome c n=1 Tax=Thalassobius vesicularis TaxID=1294297 RepID=A0A4S3M5U0_9RHOB|nr:cytochrome c [Thalassobius vesicularis]THD72034.1 cytochrome c [Thalassobius vesicularis]
MKLIYGAVFALAASGAWAEGFLPYDNPMAVELGQKIYADQCAACHGEGLEGQEDWKAQDEDGYLPAPPHDPSGHTWHHADEVLFKITKYGAEALVGNGYKSRMSGFGEVLSDAEIVAVLAYIKSTWPQKVIEIHNGINAQQ